MKTKSALKIIAIFLVIAMTVQDAALAAPAAADWNSWSVHGGKQRLPKVKFSIPDAAGFVAGGYRAPGTDAKTVIIIEDAHANPSAQLNAARIIGEIAAADAARTIYTEGAQGDVTLSSLPGGAQADLAQAKALVQKARLSGFELADLTAPGRLRLWGVEDERLYDEALELYRRTADGRAAALTFLDRAERAIDAISGEMFTAQLKELFAARTEHEAGDLSTVRYFERILAAGTEHGVTLSGYKNLGLLRRLVRDESKIDEARLAAEQTEVIGAISAKDQRELGQPDSGLSPVGVLAYWQSARERGALINKGSQLEQYLKYLRRCRKLDAAEVSGELSHLEKTIFNALARSEDARTLLEIIRRFETLRHLLTLQAVPDDFAAYQANRSAYDSARLTAFLNARIHALGRYYDKAVFLDEDFEQAEKNAAAFYQISARRDSAMVSNLVDRMNAADEKQAVLVAGGFHAPGLERELRTRGISYLLVIPAVTHPTDTALYEKRLLAQKAFFRSPSTPTVAALAERAGSEPAKKSLMLRPLSAAARMHDADAIESLNELGISRPDYPAVVSEAPAVAQPANLNPIVSHALDMPVSDHVRELLKSWLYPGKAFGARLAADSKAAGGRTDVLRVIMVSTALVYAAYAVAGIVGGLTAAAAVSAWRGSAGLRLGRIKTAIFALALSAVFLLGALDSRVQELSDFIQLRHLSVEQRRNLMDRYLRIAVENELAYDLFGAPLFGAEHKAAVTSLRLFFAETETSNRHIDQEGGEAVYPEQLEPDTIKTVLIRMFRDDADGHLVSALLQNLQTSGRIDSDFADELQSLSRRVLQERVSKQHDAAVMTDLMQWIHPKLEGTDAGKWNRRQKDFHNLMFHLNLYYEMKTKGLALPDAEDAAAMIHFYKLVWRPGKTILPRLRLKLWKLKPLMRPTAEIRVHAEAVAREFGTRADFADDLDHAFILMGRARNRAQKGEWSGMFWYQGFAGWMLERVQTETRSRSSGQSIMEEEAFIDEARQALEKDRAFYRTRTVPPDWGGARMADHGAAKELHEGARAADQFKYLFADDSRQVLDFVFGDTGVNPEDIEMLETEARGRQGNMRGIRNIRIMKIRKIGDADTKTLFMKFYSAVRDADAASQEILSEVAYHRAITGHFGADAPVIRAMAINDLKSQWASENGIHSLEIQEMAPGGELNREAPFTRILWRQAALSLGRLHQHVFDRDLFVRVGGRRGGPNLAIKRAHVFVDDTPNQERVTFIDLGHALPADTANARHIEVEEELFLDLFEDMFGQGLVDRGEYPDIRSARLDFESEYKRGLADRAEGARMAAVASRGKYGDEENQDSFLQIDLGEGWNVLAVFDGVGGSEKGAQASQAARDGVKDYFDDADVRELLHGILTPKLEKSISPLSAVPTPHSEIPLILEDAIARAQEKVRGVKSGDKYSATTALIALVRSDWDVAGNSAAWTINYGDCQSAVWDPSRPDQLRLVGIANMEQGLSKKGQRRLKWNQNYLADLDDAQVISSIYDFEAAALEGTGHSHAEPEDRDRLLNHYRRLRGQGIHLPFTWKQAETWIYRRMTTAIENGQGSFVWPSGVNETRIPPGGVLMLYTDGIGDNLTRREIARVVERNFGASPAPSFRGDWRTPEMRLADDLIWAVHDPTYVIHPMPGKDGSKPEHYSADTRGTVDPRHKRDDATVVVIRNRPTAPPAAARMADHLGSGKMTRRSALAAIAAAVGLRPDRAPGSDAGGRVLSGWSGRVYLLDSGEIVPAGRTLTEGQARVLSADDASLNVSPIWDGECNLLLVRSRSLPGVMGVAHLANGDEARSRAAGFPQRFSRAEVEEQFDGLMGHLAAVGITPEDAKAQLIRYGPSHVENVVEGRPFMDVWKEVLTARLGAAPAEREVNPVPRTVGDQAADRHNVMRRMWSNLVRRDDESFEIRSYADAGVLDSYGNEITLVSSQPVLRAEVTPDGLTDKPLISIQEEIWELIAAGATGLTGILLGGYGLSLPVRLLRSRVPINRPNLIGLVRSDLKSLRDSFRSPGSGEGMDRSAARMAAWVDRAIPVVWSNELRQAIRQNSADVHAAASDIIRQLGSMVIENNIRDMNVDAYVKALERGFGNALRARIADITDFESRIIGFYRFMMSSDTSSGYLNGYSLREAQDFRAILAEVLQHEWTPGSDENAIEDEVVSYAADVFSRIVSLQAFENGNHRIGDFVMNFILAKNGFPTFVLTTSNVVEYYRLFNTSALRGKTPADVSGRVSFIRREIRNHTPARIHTARTATLKDGARMAEDDPDTVSETRKLFGQGTRKINKASEDASGDDLRIAGFTDLEHAFLRHQTTAEERHEILEYLLSHLRPPLTTGKADTHAAVQNKDLAESVLHHVLQQMPHQIRIQEFTDIAKIIGRKMMGQNGFSKKFRENIHRQLIFAMMTEPAFVDEVRAFEGVAGDSDEHTLAMELMQSYRAIPEELIDLFRAPSAEASVEGIRDWISEHEALITDVESDLLDWAIRMMVYQAGARMADEGPLNNLSSVQYVLATPEEKADILERARQSTIRGKTGYFDRFVTGMRRRLTSEDKKLGQLIGAIDRARPEGDANEWGRLLETRLPHDGVVRSDDGSYWIVKSKGYDSARGDVKNEGRRERLAYLMAERAGVPVAEVRRITPNQAVSLGFQERDAESKYLVRIVERGNYALQRKTNTPASNRSGIWALDLLTRRYDHHIDNYGFAGEETDDPNDPDGGADSMVAVDMDEGLKPKTFIDTDQSTAVMKYTGSHAEHSILMPFETLLTWLGLSEKDIQYDLNRAYQARKSGRDNVRRWNEAVARLAKKYRLIDAFMEAEGIRPGQIRAAVAHLQAVLDRESILKMAEEAGYSEAEAAGIADWLNDNLKSLDDHAREYWSIMNDEAPLADSAVKEESAGQPGAEGARMAEVNERTEPDREALATSLIDHYSMNVDVARQRAEDVRQGSWTRVGKDFALMDGNGKRAAMVSEMGTRRFFDTNGRWILTLDPNGNKIDELEWDASGKFKRAWTLNTNFTEVVLEPDASDGTISHIRMRVRDEQGVREDVIYDCEPGLDLNRPGEIPYGELSWDSTILEEDRNGFAVAIFRMLAILVADLGSDARLKYMGDIPSDALYNSLAQVARPDMTRPSLADAGWSVTDTAFLTPTLGLAPGPRRAFRSSPQSVAWIPDAPEQVFSPHSAMSLSYRNGTLERASYEGIIYKLPQYQTGAISNHAVGIIEGKSDGTYQLIYDRAGRQTDIDSAGNILRKITLDEVEDEDTPAEIIWINLTEDDKDLLRTAAARILEARSEWVSSEGGRRLAVGLDQGYAVVGIEQMGGSLILKIGEIVLAEWRDAAALREAAAGVSNPAIATTGQKLADSLMSFDAELIRASDQAVQLSLSRKRHFSTWTQVRTAQLLSSDPRTRESELHLFLTAIHWLNTQTSFSDDRYYLDPEDLTKEDLEQIQEFIRFEDTHSIFLGSLDQAELTEHPDVVPAQWYADAQGQMRGWVNILMPSPNEGLMPVGRAKQAAFLAVLGTTDSADETVGARVIFEQADKFDQTIYAEHVVGVYGGSANFGSADQFLGSVRGEIRLIQRLPFHPIRAGARLAKLRETLQQIATMA